MPRPFFRSEALAHQRDALNGEVLIARSPTIRLLVWVALLFTVVLLGLAFGENILVKRMWWAIYHRPPV